MFSLLWDDTDQYLGFVGIPKPPVNFLILVIHFASLFYHIDIRTGG